MLHKPTEKKLPKRYPKQQNYEEQVLNSKSANRVALQKNEQKSNIPRKPVSTSVQKKVNRVESTINKVESKVSNAELQSILISEIKGIKDQLKEIKQQIGLNGRNGNRPPQPQHPPQYHPHSYQQEREDNEEPEQNIFNMGQKHQQPYHQPKVQIMQNPSYHSQEQRKPQISPISHGRNPQSHQEPLHHHPKQLIDVGKIQPYMKQFKVEATKRPMPYYQGYHKKSSKPVIIKYCEESKSMDPIFNLYEKLWKNIVKAKQICINKVYDLNEPLASYIMVIEANQHSLDEIVQYGKISIGNILVSILKALQFFHQCGYLYRNMHPWHIMQSFEGNITIIDLKNMKRFVDMKGRHMIVKADGSEPIDEFVSNARIRKVNEGRKDDLQTLGYLALYLLEGQLPWNMNNMIHARSTLTLKQLYGEYPGLLEYMIVVNQMQTDDVPDYQGLGQMLKN